MKKFLIFTLLMFSFSNAFAAPDNVYGKGDKYIKVSLNTEKTAVKFELYSKKEKKKLKTIGEENRYYEISTLERMRGNEKWHVFFSSVATVATVAATAGGSGLGYLIAVGGIEQATSFAFYAFAAGGAFGGGKIVQAVNSINPYEQYKQLEVISEEVVNGSEVHTKTDIVKFAKRLHTLLEKL